MFQNQIACTLCNVPKINLVFDTNEREQIFMNRNTQNLGDVQKVSSS